MFAHVLRTILKPYYVFLNSPLHIDKHFCFKNAAQQKNVYLLAL